MSKVFSRKRARSLAIEQSCWYGVSIFTGAWYVGPEAALRAIGVATPINPQRSQP